MQTITTITVLHPEAGIVFVYSAFSVNACNEAWLRYCKQEGIDPEDDEFEVEWW